MSRAPLVSCRPRMMFAIVKGCPQASQQTIDVLTQILGRALEHFRPNRLFRRKHAVGGAHRLRECY